MRMHTAGALLLAVVGVSMLSMIDTPDVVAQNDPTERSTTSLDNGAAFDLTAQYEFETRLTSDERARLIKLKSRFALADPTCTLKTSEPRQPFYVKFSDPLDRATADALTNLGASFIGYAYPNTHFLRASDANSQANIRTFLLNTPTFKGSLTRDLMDQTSERVWAHVQGGNFGGADVRVLFWRDVSNNDVVEFVNTINAGILHASVGDDGFIDLGHDPYMDLRVDTAGLNALIHSDLVDWVQFKPQYVVDNVDSQTLSDATASDIGPSTAYNLDGTGMIVGVWDGGTARDTHQDFQGAYSPNPINAGTKRILRVDTSSHASHPTHVTGTIAGDGTGNAGARGFAPKAWVLSHDWNNMDAQRRTARHNYRHVADNHSYGQGPSGPMGGYDSGAQSSDIDIRDIMLKMCKSSGNYSPGSNTANDGTCMKNAIVVGAAEDNGDIASFSSRGPTDDGRMVPHVVANGVNLLSTMNGSDTDYAQSGWSGTSMSSPSVCGSMALLSQLWDREMGDHELYPDVTRGILAVTCEDRYNQGPDYRYGFGIVKVKRAADLILANKASSGKNIVRGTIRQGETVDYDIEVTSSATPLKVACSWLDIYGSAGASVVLVNNINVELIAPNGTTTHYPWSGLTSGGAGNQTYQWTRTGANNRDNIELVEVDSPAVGTWTIRVTGASIPANPQNTVLNDATGFVLVSENDIDTTFRVAMADALNTGTPVNIPDNSTTGVTRTFNVADIRDVNAVRVIIDIRHPRRGDIDVYLTAPDSTVAHIEDSDTSTRDDIIAVYPDTRQYDDDVDAFIGKVVSGTWSVTVTDTSSGNSGTIEYLAIEFDLDGAPGPNYPPVADAGVDFNIREQSNGNLDATGSTDANGHTMTYAWTQIAGSVTVTLNNANTATPSFTAPTVSGSEQVTFRVTVSDPLNATDTDDVVVTIGDNQAPTVDAGADFGVVESRQGQLNGSATDPEGDSFTYSWVQTSGPSISLSNSSIANPTFNTPGVLNDTDAIFELTCQDNLGDSNSDTVTVTIEANLAPNADAGPDQGAIHGATVNLDASGSSDPNTGDTLSYSWAQVGGTNLVTLSGAMTATASFTAPASDDELVFEVTVMDSFNEISTDQIRISVNATGTPLKTSGGGGGGGKGKKDSGGGGCVTSTNHTGLIWLLLIVGAGVVFYRRRKHA